MSYKSDAIKKEAQYKLTMMERQTQYDVVKVDDEDLPEIFSTLSIIAALMSVGMQTELLSIMSMVFAVLADIYTHSTFKTMPILVAIGAYYLQRVLYVIK